jgi:DNA polymerase
MEPDRPGAGRWVPARPSLASLRSAAHECRGCELYRDATQVVFSEGMARARIMLVGEQPGDKEDLEGEPFVGPAGRMLAKAVGAAGIPRKDLYVTNAVKHFRFERRGKRRIHEKPGIVHIEACHPWLEAELRVVRPDVVVALGATAGRALLGRDVRIGAERGRLIAPQNVVITTHPSALLRIREEPARQEAFDALVADLRVAVSSLPPVE